MERKQKKWEEKSTVKHEEVGNIEKNIFVNLVFLKQIERKDKKRYKKTHDY